MRQSADRRTGGNPTLKALKFGLLVATSLVGFPADAQTANNLRVLRGLAPVTVLPNTVEGRAAPAANFTVTGSIQIGALRQPTLLPFADQQQQALKDAFIDDGNVANLADGLRTTLSSAYLARAHYADRVHYTSVSQAVADLIPYTNATTGSDSNSGKYFFANATTDGRTPVSDEAAAILKGRLETVRGVGWPSPEIPNGCRGQFGEPHVDAGHPPPA